MNRSGPRGEMDGMVRWVWRMLIAPLEALEGWNWPCSRKDLMLDMSRREEAEGDSRMMGSGRRWLEMGFLMPLMRAGLPAIEGGGGRDSCEEGCARLRPMKDSACLRMMSKS